MEQRAACEKKKHSECDAEEKRKHHHPCGGLLHLFLIACAEPAADGDGKTVVQTHGEHREHAVEGRSRPDLCESDIAEHISGNSGVGEIVELLQQTAEENGQCKGKQDGEDIAGGHIQCFRLRTW